MRIAICAGHHESARGAVNEKYMCNEHDEAVLVVEHMRSKLFEQGHYAPVFGGSLRDKITAINDHKLDLALDIHFNSGGGQGCEVLYVPRSIERKRQAAIMSKAISEVMGISDRGAKPGFYQGGRRPGTHVDAFVARTTCPAFIVEPFFIDNDAGVEYWFVNDRHERIADAIVSGITEAFCWTETEP